jgi:transketolase
MFFRIGHDLEPDVYNHDIRYTFGKAKVHGFGDDLTLLACRLHVKSSLDAAAALQIEGVSVGVIDMAAIEPIYQDAVPKAADCSRLLMTAERTTSSAGLVPHQWI